MNEAGDSGAPPANADLADLLAFYATRVEAALNRWLPPEAAEPQTLHRAMRYAVLGGGKRLRAVLTYASGAACGAALPALDRPACSVELLHAYSLIHDDLPAMDDDDLRRGIPSCHKAFDEATAILAGDALQTLAFDTLADPGPPALEPRRQLQMVGYLARTSGSRGMAGGQAIDLESEGKRLSLNALENMHSLKTGALIRASVRLGALCAPEVGEETLNHLDLYARSIGLAFQIRDDVLDVESDTETLGKPQGSDTQRGKSTYPSLVGLNEAKAMADTLHHRAVRALGALDARADPLRALSQFIISRNH